MGIANDENPSVQSVVRWVEYMARVEAMSEPDLIAMWHATVPSRHITVSMSYQMFRAPAMMRGRLKVPMKIPRV